MKTVYKWRDGARITIPADVAGPELARLSRSGATAAEVVVEEAKNKHSPLHEAFDWNIKNAAHQHWLATARLMLRSICVVVQIEGKPPEERRLVVGVEAAEPERRYIRPERMTTSERDAFAKQLVGELRSFARRNAEFRGHALLREVYDAINRIPLS
jgi:hypothetical protein